MIGGNQLLHVDRGQHGLLTVDRSQLRLPLENGLLLGWLLRDFHQYRLGGWGHVSIMRHLLHNEKNFVIQGSDFFTASHGRGSDWKLSRLWLGTGSDWEFRLAE